MGVLKKGVNDLQTVNPELAKEWDFEKNGELTPERIAAGSHKYAWWICLSCGYSWKAQVYARNNGNGCPNCRYKKSGESIQKTSLKGGKNTLKNANPSFLIEWDYDKNKKLTPSDITPMSNQKVWWKCRVCGFSFFSSVCGRMGEGKGCPVCAGRVVAKGINDLETINPRLAKEWDFERNNGLLPSAITAFSSKKVFWKCPSCGYNWKAAVSDRSNGTNCPMCAKRFHSSLPEQILFKYIHDTFSDAVNSFHSLWLGKNEIDIFIPSLRLAIEYDGEKWHQIVKRDLKKDKLLIDNNIRVVRIREPNLPDLKDDEIYIIQISQIDKNYLFMEKVFENLTAFFRDFYDLDWKPEIRIEEDKAVIMASLLEKQRENSLEKLYPNLLDEWDYSANKGLSPKQISAHNDYRACWVCKTCGYKWKASINDRVTGHGCPFCAGVRLRSGFNDFKTKRPDLLEQWDYDKNGELLPEHVAYRSNKKVWWHCFKCGESYLQQVCDKSKGIGCPICAGKKIVPGINDLATKNPLLAAEWDFGKNGDLTPSTIAPNSNKKVWWCCKKCGHSWQAVVYSRNGNNRGCPICARERKKKK